MLMQTKTRNGSNTTATDHRNEGATMDFFERIKGPPRQVEETNDQRRDPPTADRLLDWLLTKWERDTFTLRDALAFGPYAIRDKNTVMNLAQVLVTRGWLVPAKAARLDQWRWQIVRRPIPAGADRAADRADRAE